MVDPAHKAEPSCPQERARGKLDSERRRAGDEGARGGARRRGWETRPGKTALLRGICDSCQKAAGGEERLGGLRLLSQRVGSQDKRFI